MKSENKVTKSAENLKFYVVRSFLCNFGAAGESFGLRKVKQLKGGLKKVKGSQKSSQKLQTPSHSIGKTLTFLVIFLGGGVRTPPVTATIAPSAGGYATEISHSLVFCQSFWHS